MGLGPSRCARRAHSRPPSRCLTIFAPAWKLLAAQLQSSTRFLRAANSATQERTEGEASELGLLADAPLAMTRMPRSPRPIVERCLVILACGRRCVLERGHMEEECQCDCGPDDHEPDSVLTVDTDDNLAHTAVHQTCPDFLPAQKAEPQQRSEDTIKVEIGLDTCASTSVCPVGFAGKLAICTSRKPVKRALLTATGHNVPRRGKYRMVPLWLLGCLLWPWRFEEMEVRRPLIAVSELRKHGIPVHFAEDRDAEDYITIQEQKIPFYLRGGIFVLEAELKFGKTLAALPAVLPPAQGNNWCVVEYGCYENSELTSAFQRRGQEGKRLGLFNTNLARREEVQLVGQMVNELRQASYLVLIWIALPCTPWTTWQYINMWRSAELWQRLQRSRTKSVIMLRLLDEMLERVAQPGVYAAFEWPRRASPWQSPMTVFQKIMLKLNFKADWDGCQFEVQDEHGVPVRKMLRLITNFQPLQTALDGKLCKGEGHEHAECRGKTATQSGCYTRAFADFVAKVVVEAEMDLAGYSLMPLEDQVEQQTPEPGREEYEEEDSEEEQAEITAIKTMPLPHQPNVIDRIKHEVLHLPTEQWCTHCVAGKGTDEAHYTQTPKDEEDVHLVLFDYGFVKTEIDITPLPLLVGEHANSGSGLALLCEKKGPQEIHAILEIEDWLNELGLIGLLRARTDSEPSIMAVIRQVAARRIGRTMLETTPVQSSSSLGAAERRIRTIVSQIRTLRSAVQELYGVQIAVAHPIFGWLVRHASFIMDRFLKHKGGKTSYEIVTGREYSHPLCPFAWMVMARDPAALDLGRAELRWEKGVWLGRTSTSAEHIIAMPAGIRRVRTIRMLPKEDLAMLDFENCAKYSIWQQQAVSTTTPLPASFAGTKRTGMATRERRSWLREFRRKCGQTAGCSGCDPQSSYHGHNNACKRRQLEFEEQRQEHVRITTGVPIPLEPAKEEERMEGATPAAAPLGHDFNRTWPPPTHRVTGKRPFQAWRSSKNSKIGFGLCQQLERRGIARRPRNKKTRSREKG